MAEWFFWKKLKKDLRNFVKTGLIWYIEHLSSTSITPIHFSVTFFTRFYVCVDISATDYALTT